MHEHKVMGVWVLEMDDPKRAHALYAALPAALKTGAELCGRCDGAQLKTPSAEAAEWIKSRYDAAIPAA